MLMWSLLMARGWTKKTGHIHIKPIIYRSAYPRPHILKLNILFNLLILGETFSIERFVNKHHWLLSKYITTSPLRSPNWDMLKGNLTASNWASGAEKIGAEKWGLKNRGLKNRGWWLWIDLLSGTDWCAQERGREARDGKGGGGGGGGGGGR